MVGGDWGNDTASCVSDSLNDSKGGIKGAESDNPMDWAAGDPESGKTDLVHSAVVSAEVDGERWAYVGLQRGEANTGTTTYSVEFNQQANKLSSPKSGTAIPVPKPAGRRHQDRLPADGQRRRRRDRLLPLGGWRLGEPGHP